MRGVFLAVLSAVLLPFASVIGGCGRASCNTMMNAASSRVEQARQRGAPSEAPSEYYVARELLTQAQLEDAERRSRDVSPRCGDAATAEVYAQKAIDTIPAVTRDGSR